MKNSTAQGGSRSKKVTDSHGHLVHFCERSGLFGP